MNKTRTRKMGDFGALSLRKTVAFYGFDFGALSLSHSHTDSLSRKMRES